MTAVVATKFPCVNSLLPNESCTKTYFILYAGSRHALKDHVISKRELKYILSKEKNVHHLLYRRYFLFYLFIFFFCRKCKIIRFKNKHTLRNSGLIEMNLAHN